MPVLRDTLTTGLQDRLSAALAALDADVVLAYVDSAVKRRTAAGRFLDGSSPGAETYSTGHKRTREKRGYQVARVDLFMTGRMLDATKQDAETFTDQVRLRYGYLPGLAEAEAAKLAGYHNTLGAGRGKVRRVFLGLTDDEKQTALRILAEQVTRAL